MVGRRYSDNTYLKSLSTWNLNLFLYMWKLWSMLWTLAKAGKALFTTIKSKNNAFLMCT